MRGLALTRDDVLRRAVIMALMCQGRVEFEVHRTGASDRHARSTLRPNCERLQPLAETGLVEIERQAIQVTATGWYFVRAVAMVFDRALQSDKQRERFSRII